jgi:delta-aminolevulinic acid dehydratase/porphobilinogen synthase
MAKQTAEKLNVKTVVECKDLELLEGDLNEPMWVMVTPNKDLKVVLSPEEYISMMETLKSVMKENLELKLEKAILSEFPIDYDDVKAVVLEEMKDSDKSIKEIVEKVKLEHPNLFYNLDLDKIL